MREAYGLSYGREMTSATEAGAWLAAASRITVLTGAGISTDSGIPDFRGPNGVWTRDPAAARLSDIDAYIAEPEIRRRAWIGRRDHPAWSAEPNAGHRALVDLERTGRLLAIVTQNIDGLHQRAGSDPARVVEVHGTIHEVVCLGCDDRTTMRSALARVADGEPDPDCQHCGGILKSATISFGQPLDRATLHRAFTCANESDVLITVGTSLQVYPVAGMVDQAKVAGAKVIIVNAEPTPYDGVVDAVIREPIGTTLPTLVAGALAAPR
jgi:NAD-dependent deacetylase